MGGSPHPGTTRAAASFELERLELDHGQLLVRGWWSGVRGMRFVRPALMVEGRKLLATLEHKPWAVAPDGTWIAAFAWDEGAPLDVEGVTLVVAPSVEVPLDREPAPDVAEPPVVVPAAAAAPPPPPPAGARRPAAATRTPDASERLHDELGALERRLDAVRDELHETRSIAAEREARCRELEQVAASERRRAAEAEAGSDGLARSRAMAMVDRDRVIAQHEEAVVDREAAVRTRSRMEGRRDEALTLLETAEARREDAIAERDEARRQREEILMAHDVLQQQLKGDRACAQRAQPAAAREPHDAGGAAASAEPPVREPMHRPARTAPDAAAAETPSGVRVIPATRTLAAHLHRGERARERGVTKYDMWVIRVLGSVAAVAFISLLVMILKAFFVF